MKLGAEGLNLLKSYEQLRLRAYQDEAGVWTIGYGHTGRDVAEGQVITSARAEELLRADVARFEDAVTRLVAVPLTQYEFDALVCFTFNVGEGSKAQGRPGFSTSELRHLVNAGDRQAASLQFARWVHSGGRVSAGLVKRRAAEMHLFLGQEWSPP